MSGNKKAMANFFKKKASKRTGFSKLTRTALEAESQKFMTPQTQQEPVVEETVEPVSDGKVKRATNPRSANAGVESIRNFVIEDIVNDSGSDEENEENEDVSGNTKNSIWNAGKNQGKANNNVPRDGFHRERTVKPKSNASGSVGSVKVSSRMQFPSLSGKQNAIAGPQETKVTNTVWAALDHGEEDESQQQQQQDNSTTAGPSPAVRAIPQTAAQRLAASSPMARPVATEKEEGPKAVDAGPPKASSREAELKQLCRASGVTEGSGPELTEKELEKRAQSIVEALENGQTPSDLVQQQVCTLQVKPERRCIVVAKVLEASVTWEKPERQRANQFFAELLSKKALTRQLMPRGVKAGLDAYAEMQEYSADPDTALAEVLKPLELRGILSGLELPDGVAIKLGLKSPPAGNAGRKEVTRTVAPVPVDIKVTPQAAAVPSHAGTASSNEATGGEAELDFMYVSSKKKKKKKGKSAAGHN